MNGETFQIEDAKYSELWSSGKYSDANWERLAKIVLKLSNSIDSTPDQKPTLIDFGFGKGTAMNFFHNNGFNIEGVDISEYAIEQQKLKQRKVYHTSLDDLKILSDNQFNIGFCNDVIEHIPIGLVKKSLEEMVRVCSNYLFISVCPTPSHHLSSNGENLHLTVKPKNWWEDLFKQYGEVKKINFLFSRSARYVINLK